MNALFKFFAANLFIVSCFGNAQWDLILAPIATESVVNVFEAENDAPANITLTEKQILKVVSEKLSKDLQVDGILKLKTSQKLNVNVKSDNWKIKVSGKESAFKSSMSIGFSIVCNNEVVGNFKLPVSVSIMRDVYVAKKLIAANAELRHNDFSIERRDVLALKSIPLDTKVGLVLHSTKKTIKAGDILLAEFVEKRPDIFKGQAIDVIGEKGCLSISLKCIAMENGRLNQSISVKNEQTNKTFYAKIISEGVARVSL